MLTFLLNIHRIYKDGGRAEEVWGEFSAAWSRGVLGLSSVSLWKNDVPGSSLDGRNPSQLNNDELRFWLNVEGDNGNGLLTRAQLVKR